MKRLFRRLTRWLAGLLRRFLRDEPANDYERAVFAAARTSAVTFGGRRLA